MTFDSTAVTVDNSQLDLGADQWRTWLSGCGRDSPKIANRAVFGPERSTGCFDAKRHWPTNSEKAQAPHCGLVRFHGVAARAAAIVGPPRGIPNQNSGRGRKTSWKTTGT